MTNAFQVSQATSSDSWSELLFALFPWHDCRARRAREGPFLTGSGQKSKISLNPTKKVVFSVDGGWGRCLVSGAWRRKPHKGTCRDLAIGLTMWAFDVALAAEPHLFLIENFCLFLVRKESNVRSSAFRAAIRKTICTTRPVGVGVGGGAPRRCPASRGPGVGHRDLRLRACALGFLRWSGGDGAYRHDLQDHRRGDRPHHRHRLSLQGDPRVP